MCPVTGSSVRAGVVVQADSYTWSYSSALRAEYKISIALVMQGQVAAPDEFRDATGSVPVMSRRVQADLSSRYVVTEPGLPPAGGGQPAAHADDPVFEVAGVVEPAFGDIPQSSVDGLPLHSRAVVGHRERKGVVVDVNQRLRRATPEYLSDLVRRGNGGLGG